MELVTRPTIAVSYKHSHAFKQSHAETRQTPRVRKRGFENLKIEPVGSSEGIKFLFILISVLISSLSIIFVHYRFRKPDF